MSFHYFMLTVFVIGVVCLLALCLLRSSAEQALRDSMEGACGEPLACVYERIGKQPKRIRPLRTTVKSRRVVFTA